MKDEGDASWTLNRAQNAHERRIEIQPVASQFNFAGKREQVDYTTRKLRNVEHIDAAKKSGNSN